MVRENRLAQRPHLPPLRGRRHEDGQRDLAVAVLLSRMPEAVFRQDRNRSPEFKPAPPQVGLRHLPGDDQPQGRQQHEAAPRHRHFAEGRVVHAAPDTGSLVG